MAYQSCSGSLAVLLSALAYLESYRYGKLDFLAFHGSDTVAQRKLGISFAGILEMGTRPTTHGYRVTSIG